MKSKLVLSLALALTAALMLVGLAGADVLNPGFETGDFTNWTTGFGLHTSPLAGLPPYTGADVPPATAGGAMLSAVLGPFAPMSQADALAPALLYPAYGNYSARINDSSPNWHQNWITQTFTIDAGNFDATDGLYHLRMVIAPVLDSAGHTAQDQPFFWVRVTNNTTGGTILYDDVFVPGDPSIPWQNAGTWRWLDWMLIDVNTGLNNGDSVTVQITAADCDAGGHGGYGYVDAIGGSIPGPTITATGPASVPENSNYTYTFTYKNGSGAAANLTPTVNIPPGVTFVSQSGCGGTGPVTCTFNNVPAGGTGTFTVTVNVPLGAAGSTITLGNYNIASAGFPTLLGPVVYTNVTATPPPTLLNLTPPSGPTSGGTVVTINGANLTGGTFTFGGLPAVCAVNLAGTQATCTTPPHAAGPVDVVVTTPGGTTTLVNAFTYIPPAAPALPATGFAPDRVTTLPKQTVAYTASDLWLEIPRLGVQMDIVGVPQSANGTWDVSWLGNNAGWLQGTAFPTWNGNSVITGHVWGADNKAGPFVYLNTLWYGDRIIVHAWGQQYIYEVRSVKQVRPDSTAAAFAHKDTPWLTLTTCRSWNADTNSYRYRVIVQAVLVDVK